MKRLGALVLLLAIAITLATLGAGWKWGGKGASQEAGWTWDDGTAAYVWVDA
jgi:hypothetical protein